MVRYWAHYTPKPRICDGCGDPLTWTPPRGATGRMLCLDCAGEALAPWRTA